ncbi:glycosyltransferase family 2 protein [Aestuariimicrobium sp. p3-SID1156]|uniref:glycosyltransferase family 2 protein n=1 Tax=Aestuariimicrobium sp. p3-SID1156 TaxID=2916038 RepID=UPI0037BE7BC6
MSRPRIALDSPVSVVMPVLNEERHLRTSVEGVLAQEHTGPLEVLLAVGPSRDDTPRIAATIAADDPRVRVIDNPTGTTPDALNLAIAASSHPVVIRVDAHGELPEGYIATAVRLLHETDAANVGGRMDARGTTPFERAVAAAYNSRLGLGGGGFHLAETPQGPAETVFLGAFRRESLLAVGGFDPDLLRAQDWELNLRLRQAGEKVIYSPALVVTYRPRSSVATLARQFFRTGRWRREVIRRHPETASLRYLAPPVTVAGILAGLGLAASSAVRGRGQWRVVGLLAPLSYVAFVLGGTLSARGLDPAARARLPLVLAVMHLAWGTGFLVGVPQAQRRRTDAAPRPSS